MNALRIVRFPRRRAVSPMQRVWKELEQLSPERREEVIQWMADFLAIARRERVKRARRLRNIGKPVIDIGAGGIGA